MPPTENTPSKRSFLEMLQQLYQRFNVFSAIKPEDHFLIVIGKVLVRIVGFVILLILSPFLLIGLMIALVFAG